MQKQKFTSLFFFIIFCFCAALFTLSGAAAQSSSSSTKNAQNSSSDFESDFEDEPAPTAAGTLTIHDPLEKINRYSFNFTFWVDKKLIAPIDKIYLKAMPMYARNAVSNVNLNITEPWSVMNHLLQFKPLSALQTTLRFLINTTLGFFGTVDVASTLGLKPKENNLDYTLNYYHIGYGIYLFPPLLGPYTITGVINGLGSSVATAKLYSPASNTFMITKLLTYLNNRPALQSFLQGNNDPYTLVRYAYFQNREFYAKKLRESW